MTPPDSAILVIQAALRELRGRLEELLALADPAFLTAFEEFFAVRQGVVGDLQGRLEGLRQRHPGGADLPQAMGLAGWGREWEETVALFTAFYELEKKLLERLERHRGDFLREIRSLQSGRHLTSAYQPRESPGPAFFDRKK